MRKVSHLKAECSSQSSGSAADDLAKCSSSISQGSVSVTGDDSEEEKARQGEGMILDSYTKIWESIPEKGGNNCTNARVSRSPNLLHSASPNQLCNTFATVLLNDT